MRTLAPKILFGLPGLFIFGSGLMFFLFPERAAEKLLFAPEGAEGLSNLRGFSGASVLAVGVSLLLAAATEKLEYARIAAIFLLTLIAARVVSYVVDGPNDNIALFLAIPSIAFAFMVAGHVAVARKEGHDAQPAPARA